MVHTWKQEDFVAVAKSVIEALGSLPKGVCLYSSYIHNTGAWCVYTSESSEAGKQIKDFLTKNVPKMKT